MAIARTLRAPETGVTLTGFLACVSPAEIRELLMASYPAVLGHAIDTAVVVALLRYWDGLRSPWGVALAGLGIAASGLTYNAGVVHFGLFLPLLFAAASLRPSQPGRVGLASSAVLGGLLAVSFYGSYFSQMLANIGKSYAGEGRFYSMTVRTELAFGDWRDVGWPLAAVAILGLRHVVRDQWSRPQSRVVAAWAAYCVAISIPVLILPEPLAYVRRLYFAFPLLFALAGCFVGRRDRLAAALGLVLLTWSFLRITTFIVPYYITYSGSLAP